MAASHQADDVPARLETVRKSLHTVAGTVLFIGSTVMAPDGPQEEVARDTALERVVRAALSDVMFESPGWDAALELPDEGTETHTVFGNINVSRLSWRKFSDAVISKVLGQCKGFVRNGVTKTIDNHIGKKRQTIAKAIRDEAKAIETIKAEVVAVQNAHSDSTGTTLQVKGVSGMSKEEAEKAWKERRVTVMTKWNERKETKQKYDGLLRKLAEHNSADMTTEQRKEDTENRKVMQASLQNMEKLREFDLQAIYGAYANDAEAVHTSKGEYSTFPVPDHVDSGDYEAFKDNMLEWCKRFPTIKKYYLILGDVMYMLDAVDAYQAYHLLPPDSRPPPKEGSGEVEYLEEQELAVMPAV